MSAVSYGEAIADFQHARTSILGRIANHRIHQIDALLPWLWTQ